MNNLTLQIGIVHYIEVDQTKGPNARGRQIQRKRRSQSARADAQHASRFQLLLSLHTYFRHDQMARVAQDLVLAKSYWNLGDGGHKVLGRNLNCPTFESGDSDARSETPSREGKGFLPVQALSRGTTDRNLAPSLWLGMTRECLSSGPSYGLSSASGDGRHDGNVITFL